MNTTVWGSLRGSASHLVGSASGRNNQPNCHSRYRSEVTALKVFKVALFLLILLVALPAVGHHGAFHHDQHAVDSGSCCVEVRAHSQCTTNCTSLYAGLWKDGAITSDTCSGPPGTDTCYSAITLPRTYSTPVTVASNHQYTAPPHSINLPKEIYYP